MKKILIISYTFPPTLGVGGRRWAKFAKYLYRKGHDVRVITAQTPYSQGGDWSRDIEELQEDNRITTIPSAYPKTMIYTKTIMDKLLYRATLYYLRLTREGYYYDPSIGWERYLIPEVEKHIKDGYQDIIATGAPFRYLATLPKLKERYPDIRLIADMRDPWVDNNFSYGYTSLITKRFYYEQEMEKLVIKNFDIIVSVHSQMSHYFSSLDPYNSDKFITINNGFDREDIDSLAESQERKNFKIELLYMGTLYSKLIDNFEELIDTLDDIKTTDNPLYEEFRFDFYGDADQHFVEMSEKHSDVMRFHGQVSLDSVSIALHQSDATIIMLTPEIDHYFNTKIYNSIQIRKPIILFAHGGKVAEFIESHRLGLVVRNIKDDLPRVLKTLSQGYEFNDRFDISQFDIENLTDKIVGLL